MKVEIEITEEHAKFLRDAHDEWIEDRVLKQAQGVAFRLVGYVLAAIEKGKT